jgi:hypothetical protein
MPRLRAVRQSLPFKDHYDRLLKTLRVLITEIKGKITVMDRQITVMTLLVYDSGDIIKIPHFPLSQRGIRIET